MNQTKLDFDERTVLMQVALGDQRAFKRLYDIYQARVYTFALRYLKSSQQAEEAVQEVFFKLWRKGDSLTSIVDLQHYIFTMTRNHALDSLRRNEVRKKVRSSVSENYEDTTNDTEETVILHETRRILEEGISKLPPQQQRVYQLCHQEGIKYNEAAKILNISEQTIHRHMKLALRFLRNHLKKHIDLGILAIIFKLL